LGRLSPAAKIPFPVAAWEVRSSRFLGVDNAPDAVERFLLFVRKRAKQLVDECVVELWDGAVRIARFEPEEPEE
jgi:hypothetical protein